jgi:protein gp37
MGANSKIEWTDHTFNPWIGCTKVHAGCANCYAERDMDKWLGKAKWGPAGTRVKTSAENWRKPLVWNRKAKAAGERRRVFCASLADVFEDWPGPVLDHDGNRLSISATGCVGPRKAGDYGPSSSWVMLDDLRKQLFELIDATPWLDWLLLSKRPENVLRMWPLDECCGVDQTRDCGGRNCGLCGGVGGVHNRRDNVWIGTSISDQPTADEWGPRLNELADICPIRFLSIEPLLGPVKIPPQCLWAGSGVKWVIVGGESGPNARPVHPDWVRSLRDQCQAAGVPFFFKQWGEFSPVPKCDDCTCVPGEVCCEPSRGKIMEDGNIMDRVGKKAAGRLLDGRAWSDFPQPELSHV